MKKIISLAGIVGVSMMLAACGQEDTNMDKAATQTEKAEQTTAVTPKAEYKVAYITGTVGYLERMAAPQNSVITVTLNDVSKADVIQEPIYTQNIELNKQIPVDFKLRYDANQIKENGLYTVNAALKVDDKTMFRTDMPTFVITDKDKTMKANLIMKRVAEPK